ncbi:MAG: LamG domain-containing protein, partial [Candidatus Staskawiczbacteria bacterium]
NWTIPSSLALGSQYYIAIYDSNPSVASRSSNHFSIVAATPQHLITVSAVNPTYLVSIPIPATWQMNYSSSSMFVSLYDSVANTNMFVSRPLAGAVGSNSYTIQLASNAAPGQYMLYVCDGAPASNGSGSNASSANPTLCGSTGPIAITSVAPVPPVAYYPFEGNANDASGNGNNGTATGAVLTPGETGQAYIFNGKNNYIDVPSASSLEPSSGVSVSAWIKTSGTNAYSGIVEKMRLTGGSQTAGYLLSISNKNTAAFYIGNGKGYSQATGKTNLAQNKWMFVTGTWDASTKKISIYVNGVLDGTGSYSSISYNAGDMTIGWDKYAANRHFNGSIDEVKVWSRVLSPSDVLNEYNSSGPTGLNTLQNNLASITDALNAIEQEIQSLMNR